MITVSLDSKDIKNLIYVIRGQLVMLDSDLAMLYQVETKVFNQVFHIELRMYQVQGGENIGFHTKGYIFKKDETYTFIIGSANMTDRALAVNKEWNTKLVSTEEGEMYKNITAEFNKLWSDSNHTKSYDEFIDEYRIRYETIKRQKKIALQNLVPDMTYNGGEKNGQVVSFEQYKLAPNSMQVGFINNLRALIERGETKALLVSATG